MANKSIEHRSLIFVKISITMKKLSAAPLAKCLDLPPLEWVMRCHEISAMAIGSGCITGSTIYGNYYGPISSECPMEEWILRSQQGIPVRHGWIRQPSNVIIDPTRWVFEGADPYVALILSGDKEHQEYDPGAQILRAHTAGPLPTRGSDKLEHSLELDKSLITWSKLMLQDKQGPPYTVLQIMWLANVTPAVLGMVAPFFYRALADAGYKTAIPVDYWDLVFPEYTEEAFGLPEEHRFLYTRHNCPKCGSLMDECLEENCEVDICSMCKDSMLCEDHICQICDANNIQNMHRCIHCLNIFCGYCDDGECPKCGTEASRYSELQ